MYWNFTKLLRGTKSTVITLEKPSLLKWQGRKRTKITDCREWANETVPERLHNCVIDYGKAYQRGIWGNVKPKSLDYSTRTYWNVPPCDDI